MDPTAIIFAARDLGIRLSVSRDDRIEYGPRSAMPAGLLVEIKANKRALLYDVLLSDALRYVAVEAYVQGADVGSVLDAHQNAIDAAYLTRDWPAYRAAVRELVKAGLRENGRVKRAIEAAEAPPARGEPQRDRRASSSGVRSRRREHGVREPAGAGAASGD